MLQPTSSTANNNNNNNNTGLAGLLASISQDTRIGRLGPALCFISVLTSPSGDHRIVPEEALTESSRRGYFPTFVPEGVRLLAGRWYYEVQLSKSGLSQIGCVVARKFTATTGKSDGVGDDKASWAYDGSRQKVFAAARTLSAGGAKWKEGDIVGVAIDLDARTIDWSLNGQSIAKANLCTDSNFQAGADELVPAASVSSEGGLRWRWTAKDLRYLPTGFAPIQSISTPAVFSSSLDRAPPQSDVEDLLADWRSINAQLASYTPSKSTAGADRTIVAFAELRNCIWQYGFAYEAERLPKRLAEALASFEGPLHALELKPNFAHDVKGAERKIGEIRADLRRVNWLLFALLHLYGSEEALKAQLATFCALATAFATHFDPIVEKLRLLVVCKDRAPGLPSGLQDALERNAKLLDEDCNSMSDSRRATHKEALEVRSKQLTEWCAWFVQQVGDIQAHTEVANRVNAELERFRLRLDELSPVSAPLPAQSPPLAPAPVATPASTQVAPAPASSPAAASLSLTQSAASAVQQSNNETDEVTTIIWAGHEHDLVRGSGATTTTTHHRCNRQIHCGKEFTGCGWHCAQGCDYHICERCQQELDPVKHEHVLNILHFAPTTYCHCCHALVEALRFQCPVCKWTLCLTCGKRFESNKASHENVGRAALKLIEGELSPLFTWTSDVDYKLATCVLYLYVDLERLLTGIYDSVEPFKTHLSATPTGLPSIRKSAENSFYFAKGYTLLFSCGFASSCDIPKYFGKERKEIYALLARIQSTYETMCEQLSKKVYKDLARLSAQPGGKPKVEQEIKRFIAVVGSNHPLTKRAISYLGNVQAQDIRQTIVLGMLDHFNQYTAVLVKRQAEAVAGTGPQYDSWLAITKPPVLDVQVVQKSIAPYRNKLFLLPGTFDTSLLRVGEQGKLNGALIEIVSIPRRFASAFWSFYQRFTAIYEDQWFPDYKPLLFQEDAWQVWLRHLPPTINNHLESVVVTPVRLENRRFEEELRDKEGGLVRVRVRHEIVICMAIVAAKCSVLVYGPDFNSDDRIDANDLLKQMQETLPKKPTPTPASFILPPGRALTSPDYTKLARGEPSDAAKIEVVPV